jgi:putative pyruvate formate lyase activating enzyme
MGRVVSAAEFAKICLALEKQGAENINIVTGSHAIPAIAGGIDAAKAAGLNIPVLWNSSSYESVEAMELLRGRISAFLPDLKTLDTGLAARFFRAPSYPSAAAAAILKMMELCGGSGGGQDRIIIRHLILPGFLESTRQVLAWFAEHARGRALLSLMTQYTPRKKSGPGEKLPPTTPSRYVNKDEYETVLGWLGEFGIEEGFCQELVTGSDWLPDFNRTNPFSSELSKPVWHWKGGFVRA